MKQLEVQWWSGGKFSTVDDGGDGSVIVGGVGDSDNLAIAGPSLR